MEQAKEALKRALKFAMKIPFKIILVILILVVGVLLILLPAATYFLTVDDGTYKEDDWSSTPYAASTYVNGTKIESDGTLYQCDHFVYPEDKFKIGNIIDLTLKEIEAKTEVLSNYKKNFSSKCKECKWLELCYGGCPKHRFVKLENSGERISYFCEAYQAIFEHITPGLNLIMEFKEKNLPWELFPIAIKKLY